MPSEEGSPAAPGKTNLFEGVAHQQKGTTCGLLPGVVMRRIGIKGDITNYATEGIRMEGQRLGVWVQNDGNNLPQPGDIYWLRYHGKEEEDSVSHVGVVYEIKQGSDGSVIMVTADSGQGPIEKQQAHYSERPLKKIDGTHYFSCAGGAEAGQRRLGGWVDLDQLVAKK
jgi:hypothetical protein